jgi:hypothetical protein
MPPRPGLPGRKEGMNRDDIIRMAQEAIQEAPREDWNSTAWVFGEETLERFANLVAAAEREACLDLAQSYAHNNTDLHDAIRARGETK